ncbi:hypothetical protein BH10BAC4_BH10BAC4_17370 [soil metagenome]
MNYKGNQILEYFKQIQPTLYDIPSEITTPTDYLSMFDQDRGQDRRGLKGDYPKPGNSNPLISHSLESYTKFITQYPLTTRELPSLGWPT